MEDKIRLNAELAIEEMRKMSGIDFGYDLQSVAWLDGFIERQRQRTDVDQKFFDGLVNVLGSYLGECVIKCFGGRWLNAEDGWCVCFNADNRVYPFNKVRKHFENGPEDSIKSFFEVIPIIFADHISRKTD